jgi:hypothetical protein
LVRAGVANVLGWDVSAYDFDATLFARIFYWELAAFASVPYVAAAARRDVLKGPFDERPILLIVDDLEQVLATPQPEQTVTPVQDAPGTVDAWRVALSGILRTFGAVATASRLLLTSRYRFTLPEAQGRDLADTLVAVQLRPMVHTERLKQWQAAQRTAAQTVAAPNDDEKALVAHVLEVAGGNPGLQTILCRAILAGELQVAREALDTVARWKASGELPAEESAAQEFFQRVSFEIYRNALTETQKIQLRAATLFAEGLPVPLPALEVIGRAAGVGNPRLAIARLLGLGLMDDWDKIVGVAHVALNPLARPLAASRLTDQEEGYLATVAIAPLAEAWQDPEGHFPSDPRGVEVARLALKGSTPVEVVERAALAAGTFLFYREHDAQGALRMLEAARAKRDVEGGEPSPQFLLLRSQCAERLGESDLQIMLLERGLRLHSDDKVGLVQLAVIHASATIARDGPDTALARLKDAVVLFDQAGDERSRAVTMGRIADILVQRGETDEALRIHIEECLPTAEATQDLDGIAHVRFSCARLRLTRGGMQQGEAQTICDELAESFAILHKLQRVDGIAVVGAMLGQILAMGGYRDEACTVLDQSVMAFEKMQQTQQAEQVRDLQRRIKEGQ